jgi:diguanylate cyclase
MFQDLFLNGTILITFVTIGNQFFKDCDLNPSSPLGLRFKYGVLTGILGCILMIYSVEIVPKVIVDFRNIAIIMASIFGGFTASIITSLIIGTFRVLRFGISDSSMAAFLVAIVMGIGCPIITLRVKSMKEKWIHATLFCVIVGSIVFTILIKDKALIIFLLCSYCIGSFIVAAFLYSYVSNLVTSNQLFRKYRDESSKDFLTGLNNVRQFDDIYNNITSRLIGKDERLSLLFIDIDFFKKVNDTYGHAEGDIVLKELGKILLKTCRDFDIVSRNGGEEFSIMLMDCLPQQAIKMAERLRFTVERNQFCLSNGKIINITISIGIATYPDTTSDFNELIKDADRALYKAKQTGRNKVVYLNN